MLMGRWITYYIVHSPPAQKASKMRLRPGSAADSTGGAYGPAKFEEVASRREGMKRKGIGKEGGRG